MIDSLVIATEFDERGLDRSTSAQLAQLERFVAQVGQLSRKLPPISIDATQVTTALQRAGGDLQAFVAILGQLAPQHFNAALDTMVQELGRAGGQFKATSAEGRALQAAIGGLRAAQGQMASATVTTGTALTQQATAFRQASTSAGSLAAALAQTGVATRQLAAQGAQPVPLNVQPAINAADTLLTKMGLATRAVQNFNQVLAVPPPPPLPPIPPNVTAGYIQQTKEVQRLAAANRDAARSVHAVADSMSRASSGALAWSAGMANLRGQQAAVGGGLVATTKGIDRVRAGLTGLALSASGTSPAIGQVVSGLLLLGGGSVAVLGVAAGVAVIATAYNLLTKTAREAAEAQAKLNDALDQAIATRNPLPGLAASAAALTSQLQATNKEIARLQDLPAFEAPVIDPISGVVTRDAVNNTETILKLEGERAKTLARIGEVGKKMSEFYAGTPQAARLLAKSAEDEARARKRAADEATRLTETLRQQQALRIAAAGGGNLTQGAGGIVPSTPIEIPFILRPALDREQFGTGLGEEIQAEFERAQRAARDLLVLLRGVDLSLKDIGNADITGPSAAAEQLSQAIFDLTRGLDAVAGASRNVGLIGDEAARAIGDVLSLGDAIADVVKKASTGNILGLVGAGINLLGGLFGGGGESAAEKALRDNTAALRENTIRRTEGFEGLGGGAEAAGILREFLATQRGQFLTARTEAPGSIGRATRDLLVGDLEKMGLSFEQLQRLADEYGITILANGKLVGGALADLEDAILDSIQASLKFAKTLDDQVLAADLRATFTGAAQDPSAEFGRTLAAAGELGASEITKFFAGIDLSDPEALKRASLGLLDAFENGQLDAKKLGKLSREDILRILGDSAALIELLGESALDAANELSIIPKGFRNAALAFQAQDPTATLRPVDIP
ncbi:MAG: hypothetical protein H0V43_08590, partial [Gemmatimonadales bacterium]|nr:hypothetical protein [Gemmatimonadales bacterium]